MKFEAIIFDLDGTLLDTLDDIADSANTVLARRGYPVHETGDYKTMIGAGVRLLVERMLPGGERNTGLIDDCLAEMREEYGRNWKNKTRPYEGVPEMLDAVAALGLKRAVLSNKPDGLTRACVAELLTSWPFDAVAGQGGEIPHKPDPGGALEMARRMDVAPGATLFLGDSGIDILTAINAGMYPAGALWGFRTREELAGAGARALLDHPRQLLEILDP
jgi:phosphoglycolate phosphatase